MLFQVTPDPGSGAVRVDGEVDMAGADAFERELASALADERIGAVDMAGVTFIDSCGLHALYRCGQQLNGRAPIVIRNPSRFVASLMKIAGLDDSDTFVLDGTRG
jgi:anti-sigma B factor antagonist